MSFASRRSFLQAASGLATTTAIAAPFQAFSRRLRAGETSRQAESFGKLTPVNDENTGLPLLLLPSGFTYTTFSWMGEKFGSNSADVVPGNHDGMTVLAADEKTVTLCRNHEVDYNGPSIAPPENTYDPKAPAGCMNLVFNTVTRKLERSWASIGGTSRNCAGGKTPWNTWLTGEETIEQFGDPQYNRKGLTHQFDAPHGWVFEVPGDKAANPQPLTALGRFVHEALAVDPQTHVVYETEDCPAAGFYRFTPTHKPQQEGDLHAGGKLEMLRIRNQRRYDTRQGQKVGWKLEIDWVPIDRPEEARTPALESSPLLGSKDYRGPIKGQGVYLQGLVQGGATFGGLEGCWFLEDERAVYFTAKSGGNAKRGQIWKVAVDDQTLELVYESAGKEDLNMPDNIAASPRGGLVICEDGNDNDPAMRLMCLSRDGRLVTFGVNNIDLRGNGTRHEALLNVLPRDYRSGEWAGAVFSPDGKWLFVNTQAPGLTFAITGPWQAGLL